MDNELVLDPVKQLFIGVSSRRQKRIQISLAAMQSARQIGLKRSETQIHFFTRLTQVEFWLDDPILRALAGVVVTDEPSLPS
jgi:hypothetical protein